MARVETYARYRIRDGAVDEFRRLAAALVRGAGRGGPAPVRFDWFSNGDRGEAAAIAIHRDDRALAAHLAAAATGYRALLATCEVQSLDVLGAAAPQALAEVFGVAPRAFRFDKGLTRIPATDPALGWIEVYTRFAIRPGELVPFRAYADEIVRIADERDPGTLRYDWYYDAAGEQCIAMDTYAGLKATVDHMKNCHEPHEGLLRHASMVTKFLGELAPDAQARLAAFRPFVLGFDVGLRPRSSGGDVREWPAP